MFDQSVIREDFIIQKERDNLSLGDIEKETGVSRSTLSRFARNAGPLDMENLIKIAAFLGIGNLSDGVKSDGETVENIKDAIRFDKNLTRENKIKLWRLFNAMYRILTTD